MTSQNTAQRIAQNPETEWLDTCGVVDPIEEVYNIEIECPQEDTTATAIQGLCCISILWILDWCESAES